MDSFMSTSLFSMLQAAFSPLWDLMQDPDVREIMVNGEHAVWVERSGTLLPVECRFSAREARNAITLLFTMARQASGKTTTSGFWLDTIFLHMRVSAVLFPVSRNGDVLCIRKLGGARHDLKGFLWTSSLPAPGDVAIRSRSGSEEGSPVLMDWLDQGDNILVSGSTGSGKTSFLNALLCALPETQRLVLIEDTHELSVPTPNHVSFEANPALGISIRDLVRQSLRFRPDRIVVGEVRGGEAFDLLQAMNTGHAGCMGTLHANNAPEALHRLEQMVLQAGVQWPVEAVAQQVAQCIQGVVHLKREKGRRYIDSMIRVEGYHNGKYRFSVVHQSG